MVAVLQDPFCVLTRHLHSPDLDHLVSEPALFFRLQVQHASTKGLLDGAGRLAVCAGSHVCTINAAACEFEKEQKGISNEA